MGEGLWFGPPRPYTREVTLAMANTLVCGPAWGEGALYGAATIDPEPGQLCQWCGEPVLPTEQALGLRSMGLVTAPLEALRHWWAWYHRWCYVRSAAGSIAHQEAIRSQGQHDCAEHGCDVRDPAAGTVRECAVESARHIYGGTLPP